MGQIYRFLGLRSACTSKVDAERAQAYAADTHLRHQQRIRLRLSSRQHYTRWRRWSSGANFAIVDEVDSILVDEARTPLIIYSRRPLELYNSVDKIIPRLTKADYELDEKQRAVSLTEAGTEKIEQLLRTEGS